MTYFSRRILPRLIDWGMRNRTIARYRPRIPPLATGRVLEIGVGPGCNFPYYGADVRHLFALEPSDYLRERAAVAAESAPFPVTLIGSGAESIPLDDSSVDTVVSTWTLCSIPAIDLALKEMSRVLKPGGRLLFLEHGRAPDADVARRQRQLAPIFGLIAGCDPTRPMAELILDTGFVMTRLEASYLDGPRFIAYHYIGEARPG
jgi:ubiquinone/menaquinone biosynthesis C-methylase UbiE